MVIDNLSRSKLETLQGNDKTVKNWLARWRAATAEEMKREAGEQSFIGVCCLTAAWNVKGFQLIPVTYSQRMYFQKRKVSLKELCKSE